MTSVEILIVIATFVFGAGLAAWLVVLGMRHMMVVKHKSKHSFDETVKRIKKVVGETDGWALYERNGETHIGTMNIPMMALPFKGIIKETFGVVGREEREMLHKILN